MLNDSSLMIYFLLYVKGSNFMVYGLKSIQLLSFRHILCNYLFPPDGGAKSQT